MIKIETRDANRIANEWIKKGWERRKEIRIGTSSLFWYSPRTLAARVSLTPQLGLRGQFGHRWITFLAVYLSDKSTGNFGWNIINKPLIVQSISHFEKQEKCRKQTLPQLQSVRQQCAFIPFIAQTEFVFFVLSLTREWENLGINPLFTSSLNEEHSWLVFLSVKRRLRQVDGDRINKSEARNVSESDLRCDVITVWVLMYYVSSFYQTHISCSWRRKKSLLHVVIIVPDSNHDLPNYLVRKIDFVPHRNNGMGALHPF